MSNSNNQLDLFHGVVLTQEQENEVKTWVENQAKRAAEHQEDINRIMFRGMLDEAGFVQGKDYECKILKFMKLLENNNLVIHIIILIMIMKLLI